ncbi:geranylgeranyl transferase type-2 subunit alpha-like protein [Dinothrombium tinctorium]|uniref:Geranylgeranyl transferase type-2 subunit alpha n=1 Tax=Dinothrombium tinctorium TaxID=1965070 RepID=A0A3S3PHP9_9ACAR|nr:geranylgeranyl transferase type-2 subunit alpha-like protein [Dinothrombium tinctorium]
MHGRLKVKTTAEKEREKRIEKEEKCKHFKAGLDKAFQMREKGDNQNALSLTAPLLMTNPDVYTLWNYRREIILEFKSQVQCKLETETVETSKNNSENDVKPKDDNSNDLSDDMNKSKSDETQNEFEILCENELELTSSCLLKNPKSYCVWHHRAWVLQTMEKPNFKREIMLCNQFLEMDERNFHCWDYRRFIHDFAKLDINEELQYTLRKIEQNFSNFSSWYYRSSLFTEAHIRGVLNFCDHWEKEYNLVENAVFTDPNDQSPWFYHKWLLATNHGENIISFAESIESNEISLQKVIYDKQNRVLITVFDKSTINCPYDVIDIEFENEVKSPSPQWFSALNDYSRIWHLTFPFQKPFQSITLKCTNKELPYEIRDSKLLFPVDFTADTLVHSFKDNDLLNDSFERKSLKKDQILNLRCLRDMEPDNKWVNLALASIDNLDNLKDLINLDPIRRNYYNDQKSKEMCINFIKTMDKCSPIGVMKSRGLTCLYFGDALIHLSFLDLSQNGLQKLSVAFNELILLETFILDENQITNISEGFRLPMLKVISLQNNRLNSKSLSTLNKCSNLRTVYIFGNEIGENNEQKIPFEVVQEEISVQDLQLTYGSNKIIQYL